MLVQIEVVDKFIQHGEKTNNNFSQQLLLEKLLEIKLNAKDYRNF
jgi:hypothetical protein